MNPNEATNKPGQLTGHILQVVEPDPGFFFEDSTEDLAFYQLFRPTSAPTSKDVAESERVAKAIRATPTQCWFNARTAILKLEDCADASYVEGWASTSFGFCFEHGWIVRGETVIDPTQTEEGTVYFAGLEFPGRNGIAEFLATPKGSKCKKSPFFFAFGFGGMKSPGFRRCYAELMEWLSARSKRAGTDGRRRRSS